MVESSHADTRPSSRRIGLAVGAWVVLALVVILVARVMTDTPAPLEQPSAPSPSLPPLTLWLDRDLPAAAANAPTPQRQIELLENRAVGVDTAAAWVDLGAARQYQGQYQDAVLDYQRALVIDPRRLDARVGIIMVDAATASGRTGAAQSLSALARQHPDSQVVAFNQGMVAVYREDAATARDAFERARALGPDTPLGVVARRLLAAGADPSDTQP